MLFQLLVEYLLAHCQIALAVAQHKHYDQIVAEQRHQAEYLADALHLIALAQVFQAQLLENPKKLSP